MRNLSATESIGDEEIDDIVENTGIDRDIVEKSVELDKAEKRLEKYNRNYREKEKEQETNNKYKLSIRNFLSFVRKELYGASEIPNFARVTSVETPDYDDSVIILHTESDYPSLPSDRGDTIEKSFKFRLSNEDNLRKLNYILDYMGVGSVKDIERVPTEPISTTNYSYSVDKVSYKLHTPEETIYGRFAYYFNRMSMKLNCIERCSDVISDDLHGNYDHNKNMFLLIGVLLLPLGLIHNLLFTPSIVLAIVGYVIPLMMGFCFGLNEFITEEPADRDYIRQKIQK